MSSNTKTSNFPSHTHQGLRNRFTFAVFHALVPLVALSFYAYLGQREHAIDTAKKDATYVSEIAARLYQEKINTTESILKTISKLPEITGNDAPACNRLLGNLLKESPSYANFGVTDKNGFIYCSSLLITEEVDVRDRSWYQETLKNEDFSVGLYQVGRITKQESVNFGYPVDKTSKVVFAALKLDWIKKAVDDLHLPEGSNITVVDREGTVLARFPKEAGFVGTNQKDNPLVKKILANGEKGSTLGKGLDGIDRYYSFVKVRESLSSNDFFVYIGLPKDILTERANKTFAVDFAVILAVVALTVVIIIVDWKKFIDKDPTSP